MSSFCKLQHFLVGISLVCCAVDAVIVRHQEDLFYGDQVDEEAYISCTCGYGTRTILLNRETGMAVLNQDLSLSDCLMNQHAEVCNLMVLCSKCSLQFQSCALPNDKNNRYCIKDLFELRDDYFGIAEMVEKETNSSTLSGNLHRYKRNENACGHPTSMQTADVACHSTPHLIRCTQFCIFGHTFKEGVVRKMSCNSRDNKWKPFGFSECQPFVDCTLNLESPGSIDCYTATARKAPLCYVRCDRYEDKAGVPRRAYVCKLNGSWSRSLPYCVKKGSGIALVPRPHKFASYKEFNK